MNHATITTVGRRHACPGLPRHVSAAVISSVVVAVTPTGPRRHGSRCHIFASMPTMFAPEMCPPELPRCVFVRMKLADALSVGQ